MKISAPMISRRAALAGSAALPLAVGTGLGATSASAGGHGAVPARSETHRRFNIGAFEVTTMLGGTRVVDENIQGIFGMNVDAETFQAASDAALIPADKAQFFFTPTVVNTGSEVILFDTGFNGASITSLLETAGFAIGDVDTVVLTHMHGDHVGGLMNDGTPTFPDARLIAGQADYDYWSTTDSGAFANAVQPLAEQMTFVGDGYAVASGVTSMAAFGHTPGHMIYMLESEGEQLLLAADTANHYVWSLGYPDWEVRFDIDKAKAAQVRREVFGMLAADKIPFVGYHMPFPAVGYVEPRENGFRYVPETYQLSL